MKQNVVSDELYKSISTYFEMNAYLDKKVEFADVFGFVSGQIACCDEGKYNQWRQVALFLSEYNSIIDLFFKEQLKR